MITVSIRQGSWNRGNRLVYDLATARWRVPWGLIPALTSGITPLRLPNRNAKNRETVGFDPDSNRAGRLDNPVAVITQI